MNILSLFRRRPVCLVPHAPSRAETLDATLATGSGLPVWNAVHELLDAAALEHLNDAINGSLSGAERVASADRAGALLTFKEHLIERVRRAQELHRAKQKLAG